MRKYLILLVILTINFKVFSQLVLTYPTGGEVIQAGSPVNISWNNQSASTIFLTLYYSLDGGANWITAADYLDASQGTYYWTSPPLYTSQLRIKIVDLYNNNIFAESNNVFIHPQGKIIVSDTIWNGNIDILEDIWVVDNAQLVIEAGANLKIATNKSIQAVHGGKIWINGNVNNKVFIKPLHNSYWGAIKATDTLSNLIINYADIAGGQIVVKNKALGLIENSYIHEFPIKDLPEERLGIVYSCFADSLTIKNSHFNNYYQVNIRETKALVEFCLFENWLDDAIDFDNSPAQTIIQYCTLRDGVGYDKDAIDFGKFKFQGSAPEGMVKNCLIYNITDKGISIGEGTINVIATNNLVYNCGYGIAIKDDSWGYLYNNTISNCEIGIGLYEKNEGLGGSHGYGYNNIAFGNIKDIQLSHNSILNLEYSNIGDTLLIGTSNISTNPLFIDAINNNYVLNISSPCIGTGYNGQNMGVNFPVGDTLIPTDYWALCFPSNIDVLYGDSVYLIKWKAPSAVNNVDIHYSSDNGLTWQPIVSNYNTTENTYNWTVPNIWSEKCKIKIFETGQANNYFESPFSFKILPNGLPTQDPIFSVKGGCYQQSFLLTLSAEPDATIYYTNDGSEPTCNSKVYNAPILIENRTYLPNGISTIPTSPGRPSWYPPVGNVFKGNVIKAVAYKQGFQKSNVITNSYFIDSLMPARYSLPIISLSTDSLALFDYYKGIYIPGAAYDPLSPVPHWTGNYYNGIEIPVNFEYFGTDGFQKVNQIVGIKPRGDWKSMPQKGLAVYARAEYGNSYLKYQFFNDKSLNRFKRLVLRAGGSEYDGTFFVDDAAANVIKNLNLEIMYSQPAISFINGEYWGIAQIRDRLDKHYFKTKYNLTDAQRDNFDIIESNGIEEGDLDFYTKILQVLDSSVINNGFSLSNDAVDILERMMDIDNYIDYLCSEIYFANYDWPGANEWAFRYRIPYNPDSAPPFDGRYRWMIVDIDAGFGGWYRTPDFNAMQHATYFDPSDPYHGMAPLSGNPLNWPWSVKTYMINAFLSNPNLQYKFTSRFLDLLNSTFKENRVNDIVIQTHQQYIPEMEEHIRRWGYPVSYGFWNWRVSYINYFALNRPTYARQHLADHFGFTNGVGNLTVDVSNPNYGSVSVNSLNINNKTDGVSNPVYPWSGIYFRDIPVRLIAKPKPGHIFVNWSNGETNDTIFISLATDVNITANFEVDSIYSVVGKLFINEFMASNSTYPDEYGEFDDWIELYNNSNDTIDIANYYITDNLSLPTKYKIPSGSNLTKIAPKGFLLLWADEDLQQGPLHVNIKLSANGEAIGLFAPDGITVIDSIRFGIQSQNVSYGRKHDGDPIWMFFNTPTPNASNSTENTSYQIAEYKPKFIYPNPVKTNTIYFSDEFTGAIYNVYGQKVYDFEKLTSLHVGELKNGVYLLKLSDGQNIKFVINRN